MKRRIITIGREFGSGGRELGRRLSEKLQLAYYDREIVTELANRTSLSEEYVERITSDRPLLHIRYISGRASMPAGLCLDRCFSVYAEQHRLLEDLSMKSDCIIVGRCADYILREKIRSVYLCMRTWKASCSVAANAVRRMKICPTQR